MQFSLVDGCRCEAEHGLAGRCPACNSLMIPKCGDRRVRHWAHKGRLHCDPWWEPETEWHRAWKNKFPAEWHEVIHRAANGEKHVADVKTKDGRVIEFQHSPIAVDERRARETFYGSMVWVVDGLRRTRDRPNFGKTLTVFCRDPLVYSGHESECALLRDWIGCPVDVFFDFGQDPEHIVSFSVPILWHLHPTGPDGRLLLTPTPTAAFIAALHNGMRFKRFRIRRIRRHQTPMYLPPLPPRPRSPESFQQYLRRMDRKRSRIRF